MSARSLASRSGRFLALGSLAVALLGNLAGCATVVADKPATGSTLLVIADTGDCTANGAPAVARALKQQPDWRSALLVEVGDLAYPAATREQLLKCHEPHFADFPRRAATPGNHDWRVPGAAGFFSVFPEPVPRVVPLGGPWTLVLLDSNLRNGAWDAQLAWLDQTLRGAVGQCLIPAWHHPRFSSGGHGDNAFIAPLWQRIAGVAPLSLHGHDHNYEALPPLDAQGQPANAGTRGFIVGTGGATLDPPTPATRGSKVVFNTWGFLRLDLAGRSYTWKAFDTAGRVLDEGRGECAAAPAAGGR